MAARLLTARRGQPPGFRIDVVDVVFLCLLAALSAGLATLPVEGGLAAIPLYLGVSFFLFCNVFRIGNRLEVFWYVPFTLIALYCLHTMDLQRFWSLVLWGLEPLKWVLIVYRVWRGPYHGILSRSRHAMLES
jgi:hypothetical protein